MTVQKGSRYEEADRQSVVKHYYDEWGHPLIEQQDGNLRYMNTSAEALYLVATLPIPPAPPVEYFVKEDEHMPLLAFKFMDDSTRWWEIAEANPSRWYPLDMAPGDYIRIPS